MTKLKDKWWCCNYCPRQFSTKRGQVRHEVTCKREHTPEQPSLFERQLAVSVGKPDPIQQNLAVLDKAYRSSVVGANDIQHGGTHYQAGAGTCPHCGKQIQHWDIVRMFNLDYFIGNATKYLFRLGLKGEAKEQINKAIHYLQKKMEVL